jgi:hypothetical protein
LVVLPREACEAAYQLQLSPREIAVSLRARIGERELVARYTLPGAPVLADSRLYAGRVLFFSQEAKELHGRCAPEALAQLSVRVSGGEGFRVSASLARIEGGDLFSPETVGALWGSLWVVGRDEEISTLGGALLLLPGESDPAPVLAMARVGTFLWGDPQETRLVLVDEGGQDSPGRDVWLSPGPGFEEKAARSLVALWGAQGAWAEYLAAVLPGRAGLGDLSRDLARVAKLSKEAMRLFCYDAFLLEKGSSLSALVRLWRGRGTWPDLGALPGITGLGICQGDARGLGAQAAGMRDAAKALHERKFGRAGEGAGPGRGFAA